MHSPLLICFTLFVINSAKKDFFWNEQPIATTVAANNEAMLIEHIDPQKCLRPIHECGKSKDALIISTTKTFAANANYTRFCDDLQNDYINVGNWKCFCHNGPLICDLLFKPDFMTTMHAKNQRKISELISHTHAVGKTMTVCNTFIIIIVYSLQGMIPILLFISERLLKNSGKSVSNYCLIITPILSIVTGILIVYLTCDHVVGSQ